MANLINEIDFEELFKEHHGVGLLVAYKLSSNSSLAEDYVQEAYVRAMRSGPRYNDKSNFKNWFLCIVRNVVFEYQRRKVFNVDFVSDNLDEFEAPFVDLRPNSVLEKRVNDTLFLLTKKDREILQLRFYGYLTLQEMSGVLGVGVNNLKSRLRYAKNRFKKTYLRLVV